MSPCLVYMLNFPNDIISCGLHQHLQIILGILDKWEEVTLTGRMNRRQRRKGCPIGGNIGENEVKKKKKANIKSNNIKNRFNE